METLPSTTFSTKAGTAGGTLLVVLLQIQTSELLKTAVLAGVGAIVSYSISMLMKWSIRILSKKKA